MPAQTVLMRRVASQDELASLLDRVLAVGLVLNEVHELPGRLAAVERDAQVAGQRTVYRAYEVRVDGQLDGASLRFLRWQHRHLPEHAAVWLEGTAEEVHEFLSACCRLGLGIEQVRRVDKDGDYPEVLWQLADEARAGQLQGWYREGLGC